MEISKIMAVVVAVVVLYSVQATAQGEGGNPQAMACVQKLLPCQPYIHSVNPPPPSSCCGVLKAMVETDAQCLCTVFNNPEMLKALKLTKENALDLPKACGTNPDVSLCAKLASSPTSASPGPTNGTSAASAVSFNRFSFLSAFVALIFF
ncbi:PREDICTED: protein YLS3-like [Camelina sativa]|uniref:Protein YLS3-like n=1 Tax=Camelina sativa TaxID=90675 RepID=A0ABM0TLV6_CAMSA|nr:PREDICTED: protein YLS3-like [Camelina sativa]